MLEGIFVEGLLYGIMALGVFITFRVLDFPDLSVDGTFPLGAAVMAVSVLAGMPFFISYPLVFLAGALAGSITAFIHIKLKVPHLLAGILTMTMLWSINIRVLGGRANLPLLRMHTSLDRVKEMLSPYVREEVALLLFFLVLLALLKFLLDLFFHTDLGLALGALGNNEQMVVAVGENPHTLKIIGVSFSNGLVALSGGLAAQYQGFADVNLGQGIIISGLASVMLGEFLIRSNRISMIILRVILGSVLFRAIMFLARYHGYYIGLTPNDLKLIAGLLIITSIVVSQVRTTRYASVK